jgi:circadian clock protein KaiC
VVKYRGSSHGANEYPFLISERGIFLVPITSMGLDYEVSSERVPTGIPRLDAMLGGKGYFRGSSIFVTGTPGTGKTSIASAFAEAACRRREKCIYFAFEESKDQLFRNMRSIGIDLSRWDRTGLLHIHATRPTFSGLEEHLIAMHRLAHEIRPKIIVIDPISNLTEVGDPLEVKSMLGRLIDDYKSNKITTLFTSLLIKGANEDTSREGVSSLMDTWIQLKDIESNGEHNRGLLVLKSRGMSHSNQIREFLLTDKEIRLLNVSLSSESFHGRAPGGARGDGRGQASGRNRAEDVDPRTEAAGERRPDRLAGGGVRYRSGGSDKQHKDGREAGESKH